MHIIEIRPLHNGAHRNQQTDRGPVPAGWAVIPSGMALPETFPFVEVIAEGPLVTSLAPSAVPEPDPDPAEPTPTVESRVAALEAAIERGLAL